MKTPFTNIIDLSTGLPINPCAPEAKIIEQAVNVASFFNGHPIPIYAGQEFFDLTFGESDETCAILDAAKHIHAASEILLRLAEAKSGK
ncbi:hypothetical protein UFOVP353_26 [uncultured Caudovirales phage]|uniref:Uncharacterized protein n=1 Tax=uncultured Caudovirales phage TaxID=2100421 RepID=A0A6J5M7K8_9CAUD|nr:hypothetical protein UFOVP353_26 [uncultured Caudovirales phage]